jgi:hypothetical protein
MVDHAMKSGLNGMSVLKERERNEYGTPAPPGKTDHEGTRALVIVTISFVAERERSAADAAGANVMTMWCWR